MSKRKIIIGAATAAVIGAAAIWGLPAWRAASEHSLRSQLSENPKTAEAYQLVVKGEERMASEPDNPEGYLTAGLGWKSIGDVLGERKYLERALAIYEKGAILFGNQNAIIILNSANLNRDLGNYERAERWYRLAITVNPGGPDGYLGLVDLYRYRMNKDSREIIDVYRQGLAAVVENANLVQNLAFYLKDLGRYADALSYFELLEARYPGQFGPVVSELRAKTATST